MGRTPLQGRSCDPLPVPDEDLLDQRLKYLNVTQFRNDIQLTAFDPGADSFGQGGGKIVAVDFLRRGDRREPSSWVVGGELVAVQGHS